MSTFTKRGKNEDGSVMVVAILILALLTIIGIAAMSTTNVELKISSNEKSYKMALYAAEAARGYVVKTPELYGPDNMTLGQGLNFPDENDPLVVVRLSSKQSFGGTVEYLGVSATPRGSGTQVGTFKAYKYKMECKGYGPARAESQIEAGFYRVGF
ncbi:MAG: hypothetical protein B1H12_07165 [Desulfobacteraceae bacterium 4484_190.2]|nr:MAG: hypothetical protein B1H12_07165 [Desulfobacteraceae bacterium 4484_190.2]